MSYFIFTREVQYRIRVNCVAILGSLPRRHCIRAPESVPTEPERAPGVVRLRKELGALCFDTRALIDGENVFDEYVIVTIGPIKGPEDIRDSTYTFCLYYYSFGALRFLL